MGPIRIVYDDLQFGEREETCQSVGQLLSRIREIEREFAPRVKMPFGIDLHAINGNRLSVAIGTDNAVVSHFSNDDTESLTALGDPFAVGSTLFYFGDHSLMPNRFLIPVDAALRIIEEWCEHGTLSSVTEWTSQIR